VSRYVPDHKGFAEFMVSPQVEKPVVAVAEAIKVEAIDGTPVKTGALADGYEVNVIAPIVVNGTPRASAEVRNSDPAAAPQEFGNKHVKGHRMLGKAASRFGDQRGPE
jgi:hypothetical protein